MRADSEELTKLRVPFMEVVLLIRRNIWGLVNGPKLAFGVLPNPTRIQRVIPSTRLRIIEGSLSFTSVQSFT